MHHVLYRHNLTGVLEGALRSSNAQFEPQFVLDRIGVRLLEVIMDAEKTYHIRIKWN